jgi:uncharacterized protein (DUF433 family)
MRVEINDYIVVDTEICHGKPTFKGTRIMVWQVLDMLRIGYKIEDILREFPSLTKEHIKAALQFASKKVAGERIVPA